MSQGNIYPTASNVSVYINGIHIDQAYRIDYKESLPKSPIYGYNDEKYTKAIKGRSLIQGLLVVNFTFPGYLKAVLAEAEINPNAAEAILKQNQRYVKNTINHSQRKKDLLDSLPDANTPESKAQRAADISKLILDSTIRDYDQGRQQSLDYEAINDSESMVQALKEKYLGGGVKSPDGLRMSRSVLTYNPVTMDVYYGDADKMTWWVSYQDVEFSDISQQASAAGQDGSSENLFEIYEFICKGRQIKRADVPRSDKD